jgi:predicted ATP-grasp superfamily ATP-dependent carboligase
MSDPLQMQVRPELRDPVLILAFEGWNDAGEAATRAVRYLGESFQMVSLARIDPEEFYDFTVQRPLVRLDEGSVRRIEWPSFEFQFGSLTSGSEIVIGVGAEPHLRWRSFCDQVMRLVSDLGVRRVVLLGAYLADVLYSLPVRVTGFASEPELMERFSIDPTGYEGPTGIVGVLASRMQEAELETVSLWAGLPHYIAATPNSRGVLALAQKLTQVLDFRVDEGPLQRAAADFEERIAEIVASDPALAEYVKDLKRREFAQ